MLKDIPHLPHAIRVSSRAKYVRFRILAGTGLEVVLPVGCPPSSVRRAVRASKDWINRHQWEIERAASLKPDTRHLPEFIVLSASDRSYAVRYAAHSGKSHSVYMPEEDQILVQADPQSEADVCFRLLQKWLKDMGREVLVPWASFLSKKHKLPVARVHIRKQKTRWASMSSSGTLSLNCHLLFLPAELVQHVLVHELCHVRHPNHGPGFQALLCRLSPQTARYEGEMKSMYQIAVPWWAKV